MILYNVTVNIDDTIEKDWLNWMINKHIPDVLETGLFKGHKMYKLMTRQSDETGITYSIQYFLRNMDDYNLYQTEFAPTLQQEYNERYSGKFVAFRSLLEEV